MHVQGRLEFLQARSYRAEEIIRRDTVRLQDFSGEGVLLDDRRGGLLLRWIIWNRRGAGPDEFGASLLQSQHNLFEPLRVVGGGRSPIMDTEIEMDDVPLPFA